MCGALTNVHTLLCALVLMTLLTQAIHSDTVRTWTSVRVVMAFTANAATIPSARTLWVASSALAPTVGPETRAKNVST